MGLSCANGRKKPPVLLVFDCVEKGTHEINTSSKKTLKSVLETLSKRINTPSSEIKDVQYSYESLDKKKTIGELNLRRGAVISVKFKRIN